MRTPLASLLFFLKHVMAMVPEDCSPAYSQEVHKYYKYMLSQLTLTMTFVDDLLDLKMLGAGVFTLQTNLFDPAEALEMLCAIF